MEKVKKKYLRLNPCSVGAKPILRAVLAVSPCRGADHPNHELLARLQVILHVSHALETVTCVAEK